MRCRLVVSTVVLVALLMAPSTFAKESITVWHSLDTGEASKSFDAICEDFSKAHPEIEAEIVYIGGYVQGMEKALVAWAGGAAPNVAMFEQTRSAAFYYSGALLDIGPYIKGPNGIDLKDFSQSMLGAVTYDGNICGLPYNNSTPLIYYNRDLFLRSGLQPQAPKTWDEILAFSKKIAHDTDGDGKNDVYGFDFYSWGWLFEAWIGQNGARVLNDDLTEFTFNSPAAVEAMQFVQNMVHEHGVAYYAGSSGYNLFWNNQLGMTERSTASLGNNILKATFDMGVAPLAGNKEYYAPIGGGNFFLMNTGTSAQKEAAWTFLKFITSTDQHARFSAASGYMGARRSTFTSPIMRTRFADEPRYRVTYEQMDVAYARPKVPFWQESVAPEITKFYKTQFAQNGNVKAALDEAVRVANTRLQEWRRTLVR